MALTLVITASMSLDGAADGFWLHNTAVTNKLAASRTARPHFHGVACVASGCCVLSQLTCLSCVLSSEMVNGLAGGSPGFEASGNVHDFYRIPGDDQHHTIFYILALTTWAAQMTVYYYGYRTLDRHTAHARTETALVA